jgi:hypothetical protein
MSNDKMRAKLKRHGWDQVMTEEQGCETWAMPHEFKSKWPKSIQHSHGTQCYWDLGEAIELQATINALLKEEAKKNQKPKITFKSPGKSASWEFQMGFRYALTQLEKRFEVIERKK